MLFGKKIRELRDEQGVLQRQLAAARFRKSNKIISKIVSKWNQQKAETRHVNRS